MAPLTPIHSVFCYHEADAAYLALLETHLASLCAEGKLHIWHRGKLQPGDASEAVFATKLEQADLIFLLLSADFTASWHDKLSSAIRLSDPASTKLVPIVIRPCHWGDMPFFGLHPIPRTGKPLVENGCADEDAFHLAAVDIRQLVAALGEAKSQVVLTDAHPSIFATMAAMERERHELEFAQQLTRRSAASTLRSPVISLLADLERERHAEHSRFVDQSRVNQMEGPYSRRLSNPKSLGIAQETLEDLRFALSLFSDNPSNDQSPDQLIGTAARLIREHFVTMQLLNKTEARNTAPDRTPTSDARRRTLVVNEDDSDPTSSRMSSTFKPHIGAEGSDSQADATQEEAFRSLANHLVDTAATVDAMTDKLQLYHRAADLYWTQCADAPLALHTLEMALSMNPCDEALLRQIASICMSANRHPRAIVALQNLILLIKDSYSEKLMEAYQHLAQAQQRVGWTDAAQKSLEGALSTSLETRRPANETLALIHDYCRLIVQRASVQSAVDNLPLADTINLIDQYILAQPQQPHSPLLPQALYAISLADYCSASPRLDKPTLVNMLTRALQHQPDFTAASTFLMLVCE